MFGLHLTLDHIFAKKKHSKFKIRIRFEDIYHWRRILLFCTVAPFVRWISDDKWLNERYFGKSGHKWTIPTKCVQSEIRRKIWISLKKSQWTATIRNQHITNRIHIEWYLMKADLCTLNDVDIGYIAIWSLNEQLYALLNSAFTFQCIFYIVFCQIHIIFKSILSTFPSDST